MAETHPNRLFIYESTANGFNHWRDMYYEAKRDKITKHSFFIGWWSKDINFIPKGDPRYDLYGKEVPDEEESKKIEWVKANSGVIITKECLHGIFAHVGYGG